MMVPCMVNSWLYCSGERNCVPGRASSARISNAINPPIRKNAKDVTRYMIPICFASVVRSRRAEAEPFVVCRTGYGRVTIGVGVPVAVVTQGLQEQQGSCATIYGQPRSRRIILRRHIGPRGCPGLAVVSAAGGRRCGESDRTSSNSTESKQNNTPRNQAIRYR